MRSIPMLSAGGVSKKRKYTKKRKFQNGGFPPFSKGTSALEAYVKKMEAAAAAAGVNFNLDYDKINSHGNGTKVLKMIKGVTNGLMNISDLTSYLRTRDYILEN